MASPYWSSPGVAQGRIEPTEATPDHGFWDFCLGYDGEEPAQFMLNIGETIKLEQTYDLSTMQFVNFCWTMRTPTEMPAARTIVNAGSVTFVDGSLIETGDGLRGLLFGSNLLTPDDTDQLMLISGSANAANNGTFRVGAVSGSLVNYVGKPGKYVSPKLDRCVLENASMVAGAESGITVKRLGARWVAQAYVDNVLRVELIEPAVHEVMRRSLKLHCSQVAGPVTMSFRLTLESVTP